MALVKCVQCGEEVSDKAKVCPHCGTVLIHIICEECGAEIPEGEKVCPKCGCPVPEKAEELPKETANTTVTISTPIKKIKDKTKKTILAVILAVVVLFSGIYINQNVLFGDDKIAYDLILEAADNFKNPESVRLSSGTLGVDKDCLFCGISATNGFGSRTTDYYFVSDAGWILEQDSATSFYKDTKKLNIAKINRKLEKALNGRY